MNRKLKRLIDEEERTVKKIADLQDYLKDVRVRRKQEEDAEIIKSIRTMKLPPRELVSMLSGIQDGSIDLQSFIDEEDDLSEEMNTGSTGAERNIEDASISETDEGGSTIANDSVDGSMDENTSSDGSITSNAPPDPDEEPNSYTGLYSDVTL